MTWEAISADRELLELAAKAAGIEIYFDEDEDSYRTKASGNRRYWNPLSFDGDALRLAVGLELHVINDGMVCIARTGFPRNLGVMESLSTDPYAATRRAIVRAAAEIGRGMP